MNQSQYNQIIELFGSNVFTEGSVFTIDAPTSVFITGPSQLREGESGTFVGSFFPTSSTPIKYIMYNGTTKIPTQWDGQGRAYETYAGITLYEDTGAI